MIEGPLTEEFIRQQIWPLFSRTLRRNDIYLANHSLGRPLDRMEADILMALDHWYSGLDVAWGPWIEAIALYRSLVARLVGLSQPDAVVPKTSAGQGLRAVLNALPKDGSPRPVQVVATRGEFDSVDFILKTYADKGRAQITWVEPSSQEGPVPIYLSSDIAAAIQPGTDLVVFPQVFFTTGQILQEIGTIIKRAHEVGAYVLVDSYHAAGVIPLQMESMNIDFMVGGSYKYARGGPGACWLAIHPNLLKEKSLRTLDTGWFAKKNTFGYERPEHPELAEGGDAWLESTPPVLTVYQALAGLELISEIGVDRLRAFSLQQQAKLRALGAEHNVPFFQPQDPTHFGAFTLLPHPEAAALSKSIIMHGVTVDARGGFVRFGPDILNSDAELKSAVEIVARVLNT